MEVYNAYACRAIVDAIATKMRQEISSDKAIFICLS